MIVFFGFLFCLIKYAGEEEETLTQKSRRNSTLKLYKVGIKKKKKGTMKPHHEAENYFLDFILKVHKVTKLEQVLGFLAIFCSYKFQNLHHWIFKPETKYKNHFFFETDTINSLLAYVKCQNIFFSVVQVHLLQKFTVRDENK